MSEFFPTALSAPQLKEVAGRTWIWSVVRGALAIIFGLIAFFAPIETALVLALVIGIFAIVDGVIDLVDAIRHRGSAGMAGRIVLGVASILFGLVILFWPGRSLEVLVILVGIWSVVVGILQIVVSVGHRGDRDSGWVWGLVAGILSVLFGVLVMISPGAGLVTIIWIVGIYAILFGVALIAFGVMMRRYAGRADPA
ncbi:MAG TPA: HdeD family acid-resistance protein [Microlunatus sp.]